MSGVMHRSENVPEGPYPAVRDLFEDVEVVVMTTPARTSWVAWPSIDAGCGGWAVAGTLYSQLVPFLVVIDGRQKVVDFVSREAFLGQALISHRFPRFRQFVIKMFEQLVDRGTVTAPDIADDPRMLQYQLLGDALAAAIRAERLAQMTAYRQDTLERNHLALTGQVDDARRAADRAVAATSNGEFWYVIPWLAHQGVCVPDDRTSQGVVGREIAEIARSDGYEPRSLKKQAHCGYPTLIYPPLRMEKYGWIWIERNRHRPDRRGWFSNA